MGRKFSFDLYRLNIVDVVDMFHPENSLRIRDDKQIVKLIEISSSASFDKEQKTRGAIYKWSVRDFCDYQEYFHERHLVSIVLARSVLEKDGLIVTDDGIHEGSSAASPPLASTMLVIFDMNRHLVAVEHTGELSQTAWKDHLEKIFAEASIAYEKASTLELEPVPEKNDIIKLFRSFDRVTRIKATLRIPNPELTRYTKSLFEDLKHSNVREYTQDMKNPNGLSKAEEARPFATAALAQQGYKKGDVQIEGVRGEKFEKVTSSSLATRGSISRLRDFVRGLHANAKTKETVKVLSAIAKEIDDIHPLEIAQENE